MEMVFHRPEVEFVSVELNESIVTTSNQCVDNSGNVEYCSGPNAPMNNENPPDGPCSGAPMFH